jgi:transposase InsO family protein
MEENYGSLAMAVGSTTLAHMGRGENNRVWLVDSGASHHMCSNLGSFSHLGEVGDVKGIRTGSGELLAVKGVGVVPLKGKDGYMVTLTGVLYVPGLTANLMSCSTLDAKGIKTSFGGGVKVEKGTRILFEGKEVDGLYVLELEKGVPHPLAVAMMARGDDLNLLHRRLAHLNEAAVVEVSRCGAVKGLEPLKEHKGESVKPCQPCGVAKAMRQPFPTSTSRATRKLELVHADLHGPLRTPSKGKGARFVLSLIDDFTRRLWLFSLKAKSDAAECINAWIQRVEVESGHKLYKFRTDRGGEFTGKDLEKLLNSMGVTHQTTAPYTWQQNGVVERWHRTMKEGVRVVLEESGLGAEWWAEALRHVAWVKNRVPHAALAKGVTPWEMWTGEKPNLGVARVFGSMACVWVPEPQRKGELDDVGRWCVVLGVSEESKAWRFWDLKDQRVRISRDARIF